MNRYLDAFVPEELRDINHTGRGFTPQAYRNLIRAGMYFRRHMRFAYMRRYFDERYERDDIVLGGEG